MAYDLTFLRRRPGQAWEECGQAAEEPGGGQPPDEAVWSAIVAGVRQVLGEVSVSARDAVRALDHVPTGIELRLSADRASVSVPYWYSGDEAVAVLHQLYALGEIIERHAGLCGYDPQAELPLAEARRHVELGVRAFDRIAIALRRLRRDPR